MDCNLSAVNIESIFFFFTYVFFFFRLSAGALAYAELGTMNTSSGAEWAYFMDAFGAPPAFLFSWVSTLVLKPSQMAIICLSFAQYAVEAFVSECEPPTIVVKMVALLAIGTIYKCSKLFKTQQHSTKLGQFTR